MMPSMNPGCATGKRPDSDDEENSEDCLHARLLGAITEHRQQAPDAIWRYTQGCRRTYDLLILHGLENHEESKNG